MEEEFDLSKRTWTMRPTRLRGQPFIDVEDVKEFIRRLKEFYKECQDKHYSEWCFIKQIDKLAGDKLIEKEEFSKG